MSDLKTQLFAYFDAVVERVDINHIPLSGSVDLQPSQRRARPGWVPAVGAAAVVIILGALSLWVFPGEPSAPTPTGTPPAAPETSEPEPPETTAPGVLSGLPPVTLGAEHIWPDAPSNLSSVELAELFARENLGWESPGATEFSDAVPNGPAWLRIQQSGVDELVDVLTMPSSDGGLVIVEVGTPWERGVDLTMSDTGGTSVTLLRIVGAVAGEVTLRLSDGQQLVGFTSIDLTSSDPTRVDFPDVDPGLIGSVLVRYVDDTGTVVATTGASQELNSTATDDEAPESCPVTIAGSEGFVPASAAPEPPPSVYDVVWFGTPELWTMIDPEGEVNSKRWLEGDRTFWWSQNYSPEAPGEITVTAEHISGSASTVQASETSGSGFNPFMLQPTHASVTHVWIELPEAGCWELTAEYNGSTLSYVTWIDND